MQVDQILCFLFAHVLDFNLPQRISPCGCEAYSSTFSSYALHRAGILRGNFDLIGYSDSDYAGCKVDKKSTLGTCQFLGRSLVSWSSKKIFVVISIAKAEYVIVGQCCAQLLWMRETL
jgi:hypothetical protein